MHLEFIGLGVMGSAKVLTEMDAELKELERRREKTQDLKQGMMQEFLIGRMLLL